MTQDGFHEMILLKDRPEPIARKWRQFPVLKQHETEQHVHCERSSASCPCDLVEEERIS